MRSIAICCLMIMAALVVGVGLVSGTVLRHIVQTAPFWPAIILEFRGKDTGRWLAIPMFVFWFVIMVLIWLFVTDIARVVSGTFSPMEIAMTIIIGIASLVGMSQAVRLGRAAHPLAAVAAFIGGAALQWIAFRIIFLPGIAHR